MKKRKLILLALGILIATLGCFDDYTLNPSQTIVVTQGPAGASPTVAVPGAPGQGFNNVAVEVFEQVDCPTTPRGELRVGCVSRITATPRLDSVPVPPEVHGPDCDWFLDGQKIGGLEVTGVVAVAVSPSNIFNLNARGLTPGSFTLEAVVRGVRSGAREFQVR